MVLDGFGRQLGLGPCLVKKEHHWVWAVGYTCRLWDGVRTVFSVVYSRVRKSKKDLHRLPGYAPSIREAEASRGTASRC